MRKSIRLTGRKQLDQSLFTVELTGGEGQRAVRLKLTDNWSDGRFPIDAEVRIKLVENKLVEVLHFGSVGTPLQVATLANPAFRAPSCQVRIVSKDASSDGLLLASTKAWTLRSAGDPEGILWFQPAAIQPRLWKLDLRAQEHPILYIDENVPNAAHWAKSDPVFTACVLPQVVTEVFQTILAGDDIQEGSWEADWLRWAEDLAPGDTPPFNGEDDDKRRWVSDLVDNFAKRHGLAQGVIRKLEDAK